MAVVLFSWCCNFMVNLEAREEREAAAPSKRYVPRERTDQFRVFLKQFITYRKPSISLPPRVVMGFYTGSQ